MGLVKRLERSIRGWTRRLLAGAGGRRTGIPPTDPRSILLVRTDRIGDVLISTPTIALLRERYPAARIDLLLGEKNATVASLVEGVDATILLPATPYALVSAIRSIRAKRYDVVINLLLGDSATAATVVALSRGHYRIGPAGENGSLYDATVVPRADDHVVVATSRYLGPLGIPPIEAAEQGDDDRRLRVAESADGEARATKALDEAGVAEPFLLISISASDPKKRPDAATVVTMAGRLAHEGHVVAVTGGPGDAAMLEKLKNETALRVILPAPSLSRFAALLRHAAAVITPDTATVHLAAAAGRPTVVIARSQEVARRWSPWGVPDEVIVATDDIDEAATQAVVAATLRLLSRDRSTAQATTR